jgi:hypothetical protein
MPRFPIWKLLCLVLGALSSTQCASATPLRLEHGVFPPARALADVSLPDGAECIVRSSSGEVVRGRIERVSADPLRLNVTAEDGSVSRRGFAHADVAMLAKVVKMSKAKRGWIGAAIGAAVSIPFGISMVGDMVVPAAILGAVIGRSTGDSSAEVVFERPSQ